jgi:two-component system nitrate/nitrite response regulator NarL
MTIMQEEIKVAILDDHQLIIDGYLFRLQRVPSIKVVATIHYGEDLFPILKSQDVDVLLLDIQVPTSENNTNPYPILFMLPNILEEFPDLSVLIVSMYAQPTMIRTLMEAGASGYILKEDIGAIQRLPSLLLEIADGGIYLSELAYKKLMKSHFGDYDQLLTPRQVEVLSISAAYPNASTAVLAKKFGVANSTFRNYLSNAYLKLGVNTRAAAIAKARKLGIIGPESP